MKNFLNTPKNQTAILLFLIILNGIIFYRDQKIIILLLTALITGLLVEYLCLKIRRIPFFFPSSAIVTVFIITLLTSFSLPFYDSMIAVVIAIISKHFIRISGRHIFNPAGLGLLIVAFIFRHDISWWGVSFQQIATANIFLIISFVILLLPAYISSIKMKKWKISLLFIFLLFVVNFFAFSLNGGRFSFLYLFDPTILFFSFVMLPEPMTSPNTTKNQLFYSFSVLLLTHGASYFSFIPDPSLASLLVGNLLFVNRK